MTNLDGGICSAIASVYAALCCDPNFERTFMTFINAGLPPLLVMGDDIYMITPTENQTEYKNKKSEILKDELGMSQSESKAAK